MQDVSVVRTSDETQEMPACFVCPDCHRAYPLRDAENHWTTYGIDAETGQKVCVTCCGYRDKGNMIMTGEAVLYLAENKRDGTRGQWSVTNWPGTLRFESTAYDARVTVLKRRHNIARSQYVVYFIGPDGYTWYGRKFGDNQEIFRARRTKEQYLSVGLGEIVKRLTPLG